MDKLDRLGWAVHRSYEVADGPVSVRTTSCNLGDWLDSALAPYRSEDPDPDEVFDYSLVVNETSDERGNRKMQLLYRRSWLIVRSLELRPILDTLFVELGAGLLADRNDAVYINMAPVEVGGRIVLLPGMFVPLLAEQRRYAERLGIRLAPSMWSALELFQGQLIPLQHPLALDGARYEDLTALTKTELGREDWLWIDRPTKVDAACTFAQQGDSELEPMSRATALHQIMSNVINLPAVGGTGFRAVGSLMEGASTHTLPLGSARMMLEAMASEFGS